MREPRNDQQIEELEEHKQTDKSEVRWRRAGVLGMWFEALTRLIDTVITHRW